MFLLQLPGCLHSRVHIKVSQRTSCEVFKSLSVASHDTWFHWMHSRAQSWHKDAVLKSAFVGMASCERTILFGCLLERVYICASLLIWVTGPGSDFFQQCHMVWGWYKCSHMWTEGAWPEYHPWTFRTTNNGLQPLSGCTRGQWCYMRSKETQNHACKYMCGLHLLHFCSAGRCGKGTQEGCGQAVQTLEESF